MTSFVYYFQCRIFNTILPDKLNHVCYINGLRSSTFDFGHGFRIPSWSSAPRQTIIASSLTNWSRKWLNWPRGLKTRLRRWSGSKPSLKSTSTTVTLIGPTPRTRKKTMMSQNTKTLLARTIGEGHLHVRSNCEENAFCVLHFWFDTLGIRVKR